MIALLTRDWGLKLIALLLAIGLWYYAVGEESIEVTRTIPLTLEIKNEQMSILETSAHTVQVTLSAPRALLSEMTSKEIQATHEIGSDIQAAGDYSFRLESREIKLPTPQVRVVKISPEIIHATIDELIVQKTKIEPYIVGDPAIGYKVREDEIQLDPNAILIEGPKGYLEKLGSIRTERIDLVGRIRSFRRTVQLELPSNIKPLSESLVDVFIPIREEFGEKEFTDISVKILNLPDQKMTAELEPEKITFVLKGSQRRLEKLASEPILAYLDLSNYDAGEHDIPVEVMLPEDVRLKDDLPLTIKTTLKKK